MGKHVERALGDARFDTKCGNQVPIKLEKFKVFKELTERVDNLELAVKEITDKLIDIQTKLKENDKTEEGKTKEGKKAE